MKGVWRLKKARDQVLEAARVAQPMRRTVLKPPPGHVPPHPSAFASFGANSWVVPPARVPNPAGVSIGAGVIVMEHSTLVALPGGRITLGDRVHLTRAVHIVAEVSVSIGADVLTSDGVSITDSWRPAMPTPFGAPTLPPPPPAPVRIGDGAYLSMNCTILPGVTVGEGAYVGEGAVVTEDVPAYCVVVGNPAQIIRRYDASTKAWEGKQWP